MQDYKYRIREHLQRLPKERDVHCRQLIRSICKVSSRTLMRWMNIRQNEYQDIPAQQLDKIAAVLGTSADALKNYPPFSLTSIDRYELSRKAVAA